MSFTTRGRQKRQAATPSLIIPLPLKPLSHMLQKVWKIHKCTCMKISSHDSRGQNRHERVTQCSSLDFFLCLLFVIYKTFFFISISDEDSDFLTPLFSNRNLGLIYHKFLSLPGVFVLTADQTPI